MNAAVTTLRYADPDLEDGVGLVSSQGLAVADFARTVTRLSNQPQNAPRTALTASFDGLPVEHAGEPFGFALAFSEALALDAAALEAALAVIGGAVTAVAPAPAGQTRTWRVTVAPEAPDADVQVVLEPAPECPAKGALCADDGRPLAAAVGALVRGRPAVTVVSASVTSDPGENGVWDAGETVGAEVRFSEPVAVYGPPGAAPVLTVLLDGAPREAAYAGGAQSDTLRFAHVVTAPDAGARSARVAANGLSANGTVIGTNRGERAALGFETGANAHPSIAAAEREVVENALPGTPVGAPVAGEDSDGDPLAYRLEGADAPAFAIDADTGQLRTRAGVFYDYEVKPEYALTVAVDDGRGAQASAPLTVRLIDMAETLRAAFEDAPAAHGGAPFTLRLRFSEPTGATWEAMAGELLEVAGGRIARARRLDEARGLGAPAGRALSALWELTVEPAGGEVTVALAPGADCAGAAAVCTLDGRRLGAAARVTVPEGTVPALTARFAGGPAVHDGAKQFLVYLGFSGPVTIDPERLRLMVLGAQGGHVTEAWTEPGRRDAWVLRVQPLSAWPVKLTLRPSGQCEDEYSLCATDGRALSAGAAYRIEGPASAPLTARSLRAPDTHDGATPFALEAQFSAPVATAPEALGSAVRAVNAEVTEAAPVAGRPRAWVLRVRPLYNETVRIELPAAPDCAAEGAICTAHGRGLSEALVWEVAPADPGAADAAAPVLERAEVRGSRLELAYGEGLDESAVPPAAAFAVTVAGEARGLAQTDPVTVAGRRVTLALAEAVGHGQTVTLGYAAPAEGALADRAGNRAAALEAHAVENATPPPDTEAPELETAAVDAAALVLTYNEALDESAVPPASAFAVTAAGEARALAQSDPVTVAGRRVTLALAEAAGHGQTVTLGYTAPAEGALADVAGNRAAALEAHAVENATPVPDTAALRSSRPPRSRTARWCSPTARRSTRRRCRARRRSR